MKAIIYVRFKNFSVLGLLFGVSVSSNTYGSYMTIVSGLITLLQLCLFVVAFDYLSTGKAQGTRKYVVSRKYRNQFWPY